MTTGARIGVVVVAAGSSNRMEGVDKTFAPLLGRPLITHTLDRFEDFPAVSEIALVLAAHSVETGRTLVRDRGYAVNAEGREYFVYELSAMGLPFVPTQGNFMMVEVGDAMQVYEELLREGVIVRPVAGYGFPRHLRISIGTPQENEQVVSALSKILEI